jgi:hypothetical protein
VSSHRQISIKLEIDIPIEGGVPSLVVSDAATGQIIVRDVGDVQATCPTGTSPVAVRPTSHSGSGSSTGTICAWAQFGENTPTNVRALAVLQASSGTLGQSPNSSAVPGVPSQSNTMWTWSDLNNPPNPIPGAGYSSAPGTADTLVVWYCAGSGAWNRFTTNFRGVTGTNNPCGLPTGSPCFSGSNPIALRRLPIIGGIYPAIWCVAVSGFAVSPFVLFNATWALRQTNDAADPTWDNAGDGQLSPSVQLKLCPTKGWELVLRFKDSQVSYILPFEGSPFGPLQFAARQETVHGLGSVALPMILVSAI